ncbi:MAG: hypothetical protein RIQ89_759 [Bacteroidota bacterium]|jgi:ion channel-forming bestrophin family protein
MIIYNPKDWFLSVFQFHKADTFRKLFPLLIIMALYSWGIIYMELDYLMLGEKSHAKNIILMHTLLGFAISMLLVFRTNTAYDRWWEGRKLWGALINNSRNFAIKLEAYLPADNESSRNYFRQAIPMYAFTLKWHLQKDSTRLALDDIPHPEFEYLAKAIHQPNMLASAMMQRLQQLHKDEQLSATSMLLLNAEWQSLTDICGACERIKNTPIPYSYSSFIKKFIVIYVATLPFGLAFTLGLYAIPVTTFIFYVLASLELIAEEIEEPFGTDTNDLPMQRMAENIQKNINEIIK